MQVLLKKNSSIEVGTDYIQQMKDNLLNNRPILHSTPIGIDSKGQYYYWFDERNIFNLDKRSVTNLIKYVQALVKTKKKGKIKS